MRPDRDPQAITTVAAADRLGVSLQYIHDLLLRGRAGETRRTLHEWTPPVIGEPRDRYVSIESLEKLEEERS